MYDAVYSESCSRDEVYTASLMQVTLAKKCNKNNPLQMADTIIHHHPKRLGSGFKSNEEIQMRGDKQLDNKTAGTSWNSQGNCRLTQLF